MRNTERMETVILARNAMATRFEFVLHGENESLLRAAGEEALDEIDRLESRLSLYRPGSEIAQVNLRAAREPVRVTNEVFQLLQHASALSDETNGAFDITIAPLVRCWGFMGGTGKKPTDEELESARAVIGMSLVHLDERNLTVRFAKEGVMLDLGAIGKGFAVERAANLLRESGVMSALIHGGTSTICAIGVPPDTDCWTTAIQLPGDPSSRAPEDAILIPLMNESLSVSAVWGRSFEMDGTQFGHVLDPRSGQPVRDTLLAAVVLPSATETDALSTALLTSGRGGFEPISVLRPDSKMLLVERTNAELRIECRGIEVKRKLSVENQSACD